VIVPEAAFDESGCLSQSVTGERWWFGRLPATYLFASTFAFDLATCLRSLHAALSLAVFELWPNHTTGALEPLSTHLNSETYELFERDTAKYDLYETAMSAALSQKPGALLAVVGAGRGPLVDRALRAGAQRIFVVEKNPSACEFLSQRGWPPYVRIFEGDMRTIELPDRIDILVSELLGSFGDNELSPECLEGCERLLAPGAVSIPADYHAVVIPIWSEFWWSTFYRKQWLDSMAIGKMFRATLLADEPKECWRFVHPGHNDMTKTAVLEFQAIISGILHGFGGWFECTLFGDVVLSNSPWIVGGSFSWHQCIFPMERPFRVEPGTVIKLVMQRINDETGVWYQWYLTEPECTRIHNPMGRSAKFGLTFE
jgi:protein arginine N-methyltransferase 5